MATIVGGIATTHVPSIGNAIAKGLQHDPYWSPFFGGFDAAHKWLAQTRPDVAVVFYNDHGLNFFLDKLPTFAVGAAAEYKHADEGWGLPVARPYPGDPAFSWHLIESLVAEEFDVTMCQEMLVDHAFTVPLALLWPGAAARPVRTIPIEINTVQHPLPSMARCFKLGQAVGRAITSYGSEAKVLVVGTGGLSHQLDGTRAGFINGIRPDVLAKDRRGAASLDALFDHAIGRAGRNSGRRAVELDRHARRADRAGVQGPQQLSHSHFQHRLGLAGSG
jgi:protocatechuate 4,5-dioxygenase beta chain